MNGKGEGWDDFGIRMFDFGFAEWRQVRILLRFLSGYSLYLFGRLSTAHFYDLPSTNGDNFGKGSNK
ncbi:hypothetical protein SAMN05216524_11251 [Mucilaginibacter sp. OK098]|nr:hypothetical protein SAMN05216524_11251 [Mucilaginibacter sp. OK098]